MPAPFLLDLSHTSHTRARTGIQRVARSLAAMREDGVAPITFDPWQGTWRVLRSWERHSLTPRAPAGKRGARWPWTARIAGLMRRRAGGAVTLPPHRGLIVPELFSSEVGRALPRLFSAVTGPRIALFHDAIALRRPDISPLGTVARFPAYLQELLAFDGIAAVSEESRQSLAAYWDWLGIGPRPQLVAIPLGSDPVSRAPGLTEPPNRPPIMLCVGTLEGRKNHVALLEACAELWQRGADFTLHVIGAAHAQTGAAALERIRQLQAEGRPLRYDGAVDEATLAAAYAGCSFTVYPSLMEGFGLPVLESLAHGKPCVCSARGALGESARGGGCVALEHVDAASLRDAIAALLAAPATLAQLATAARARPHRSWQHYADDLTAWAETVRRRP